MKPDVIKPCQFKTKGGWECPRGAMKGYRFCPKHLHYMFENLRRQRRHSTQNTMPTKGYSPTDRWGGGPNGSYGGRRGRIRE